ncbi:McrC family protein [Deltaproteobacteria bacterium]|nr:McrC family protein [Deltaproteobacteria bacterium]
MQSIEPNHDFLGLIGIEFDDGLRLYGVTPRFWYQKYSPELYPLEQASVRILRQKEEANFDDCEFAEDERRQVEKNIERIKLNYNDQDILEEDNQDGKTEADEDSVLEIDFKPEEVLTNLFNLCEFYRENQKEELFVDSEFSSNRLPLFLYENFVGKLEANTRELRRTYRSVVEQVGAVRGKITTRGMMMMVARPSPRIECEFETFDVRAPLYRVMMTTLDVIRSSHLPSGFKFLDERFQQICRRGANLRMKLIEIPSFPLASALRECRILRRRLPRMFKQFEEIIPLAEQILRNESEKQKEEESEKDSPWWHITAPSSKLWELLLEKSLEDNSNYQVESQESLEGPWEGSGQKNIDLCIQPTSTDNNGVFLVDAKYAKKKDIPSSGYQYQQFFYAVAWAAKGPPPSAMALVHPASNEEEEKMNPISYNLVGKISTLINKGEIPFKLWTIRFPQPEDLEKSNLVDYLSETNKRLEILMAENQV